MAFIPPMLSGPAPDKWPDFSEGHHISEEKFDGIRLIIEVDREHPTDLFSSYTIRSWSRNGILHAIPKHLQAELGKLPTGMYDGEKFVPKKRSYGATRLKEASNLQIMIFDVLSLHGEDTMDVTLKFRRKMLEQVFNHEATASEFVHLAPATILQSVEHLERLRDAVWDEDGEGLIIKDLRAIYKPKKRPKNVWMKVKRKLSAVLTVIGFLPSEGEVIDRGPYARVVLQDDEGFRAKVKTRNDIELARFERDAPIVGTHPAIGRKLRIEYQERTPDGGYRHPHWDRWEDE